MNTRTNKQVRLSNGSTITFPVLTAPPCGTPDGLSAQPSELSQNGRVRRVDSRVELEAL